MGDNPAENPIENVLGLLPPSWGKSLGEHTILPNEAFFGGDLHNLCEMSV